MKKALLCCTLYAIIIYLTSGTLNPALAATQPSGGSATHVCGVIDDQWNKQYLDQYPNRRYAQTSVANLNVGEPRTVRLIYFLPNDRPYRADIVQRMKDDIRNIQTFYGESMQAHGYGYRTFKIETDAQGEPVAHRVNGQHPDIHYIYETENTVHDEIEQAFDVSNNIYYIIVDNSINAIGRGTSIRAQGVGSPRGKNGGAVLVPSTFEYGTTLTPGELQYRTGAHELGHAFGLQHDFRHGTYIMSYGPRRNRNIGQRGITQLSACNADFLAVHPYFNPDIPTESGQPPTIELTSPSTYPTASQSVEIQLKLSDSEGLHQVILFVTTEGLLAPVGFLEVKACRKLAGKKEAIVDFEYDGDIPSTNFTSLSRSTRHSIRIAAIDTSGDVHYRAFTLSEILPESPPPVPKTLVKISGDNQQGPSGMALINPLVVEVRDLNEVPLPGVQVKFTVTSGNGKLGKGLTIQNVTTDASGQANGILTPSTGANTVEVSVSEGAPVKFHVIGVGTTTISRMSGDYRTWGLPTGTRLRLGKGGCGEMDNAIAFSPDGQYLAVSSDIGVWLYDATTYKELALLSNPEKISTIAFSSDGKTLLSGAGGDQSNVKSWKLNLWNVATREKIRAFAGGNQSVAFSSDGNTIASAFGQSAYLWDIVTGQELAKLQHEGVYPQVNSISFSPDGTALASGADDGTVKLWNVATGQNIATLIHKARVNSVAFSPSGKVLASGSGDLTLKLWDIATGTELTTIQARKIFSAVAFSPDGKTLAWSHGKTIKLWNIATQTDIATFEDPVFRINSIAFSPDGKTLASASHADGIVKVWDVETGNAIDLGHTRLARFYNPISFSPDGEIMASGALDGTVKLWDVVTGQNIGNLPAGERGSWVRFVLFSSDGRTIASRASRERMTRLWNVTTQTMTGTLDDRSVVSWAFSPNSTILASGATDGTVKLWDIETRQNIVILDGHVGKVNSLAFSPDGKTIASSSQTIKLWDVATRQNIATIPHEGSVEFSADGKILASRTWDSVKLWDITTQTLIATFARNTDYWKIGSMIYSSDGEFMLMDFMGTMSLWDALTQTLITTFKGYAPDERTFAAVTTNNTVLLGDIETVDTKFDLSIPTGISLIHVPLKVTAVDGIKTTIEWVSDLYDALGGADVVNALVTYDDNTQEWFGYSSSQDRGTFADKPLTDDKGVIAIMSNAVTLRLQGSALGRNGRHWIRLRPGVNLVGIPLRDSRITRISDLFTIHGIQDNVVSIIVSDGGEFKGVGRAGDDGDISITGGQSFLLNARTKATVTIYGGGWYNAPGVQAAPLMEVMGIETRNTTPVLVLRGSIVDQGKGMNKTVFRVIAKNLSNGKVGTTMIKNEGSKYQLTFVDIETARAAQIGDILEISAQSTDSFVNIQSLQYTITAEDVKRSRVELDSLIAYEIPSETELLANYPNPFNPETWIPFRLAEEADVMLTIYDVGGRTVRSLDIGHKQVGMYEIRNKAIYWDGRNEFGEGVTSGVYFYHLSAGDYSATRRMVIIK